MTALTFLLAVVSAALLGYHYRQLRDTVEALKTAQEERRKPREMPKATLLDPDDVVARAKWEHEQQLKKLNGGE